MPDKTTARGRIAAALSNLYRPDQDGPTEFEFIAADRVIELGASEHPSTWGEPLLPCPACGVMSASGTPLRGEIVRLRTALATLLSRHTSLVDSGGCGFWDPEKESDVIKAREALAHGR